MRLRRINIANVRSFLEPQELRLDSGNIAIAIGPNGGGKTNLLDITATALRRHLLIPRSLVKAATPEVPNRMQFQMVDPGHWATLERHSLDKGSPQVIEVEVESTATDIENMIRMRDFLEKQWPDFNQNYVGVDITPVRQWKMEEWVPGQRFTYRIVNDSFQGPADPLATAFHHYLSLFEVDMQLRNMQEAVPLSLPFLSLPVNRAQSGFTGSVTLSSFNDFELRRSVDSANSRSVGPLGTLALGRLAARLRSLETDGTSNAQARFYSDSKVKSLTAALRQLGYEWSLNTTNIYNNQYEVELKKEGSIFLAGAASSGEREFLTYLFALYALDVRGGWANSDSGISGVSA